MKTFVIFLPIILLCTSKVIADGKRYTYSYDRYGRLECTMHSWASLIPSIGRTSLCKYYFEFKQYNIP